MLALGTILPWGAVGGGHDIGVTQAPGQVAIAAAVAAVALAIMPRIALALLAIALRVFGILLPTGALAALHLASASFLRERGADVLVATYDERMACAATGIGLGLYAA